VVIGRSRVVEIPLLRSHLLCELTHNNCNLVTAADLPDAGRTAFCDLISRLATRVYR
jgi:hypothetical protein